MKITAPFDSVDEVKPLIDAGADELFCGVYSDAWRDIGIYPNARYISYGNLENFKQLKNALSVSKGYRIPVYLCINEFLGQGVFGLILDDIAAAVDVGIDGFIIADFGLIPSIKKLKNNCKIILSSLNPCFNRHALRLYKDLGVDRFVFPYNQLTLNEIQSILSAAQEISMETEMFVHSDVVCKNINGYCLYNKIGFKNLYESRYKYAYTLTINLLKCALFPLSDSLKKRISKCIWSMNLLPHVSCRENCRFEVWERNREKLIKQKSHRFLFNMYYQHTYCALCSLWLLNKFGLTAGKIPGRGSSLGKKIKDIRIVKQYLVGIEKGHINDSNFQAEGKNILKAILGRSCSGTNCYHVVLKNYQA
jgi:U32 family peptidase